MRLNVLTLLVLLFPVSTRHCRPLRSVGTGRFHLACWLLIAALAPSHLIGQDAPDPLWTYTADEDIKLYALTGLGTVLVSTKEKTAVLDPESGSVLWETTDFRECERRMSDTRIVCKTSGPSGRNSFLDVDPISPYLFLYGGDGTEARDLETGETVWDANEVLDFLPAWRLELWDRGLSLLSDIPDQDGVTMAAVNLQRGEREWVVDLPFVNAPRDVLTWTDSPMALFFGETENSEKMFLALDVRTGSILWTQDRIPREFKTMRHGGFDGDSVLVVYGYLDDHGPMGLDVETGEVLWQHEKLDDVCCMQYLYGTVFIAHGKEMTAFNAADGATLWTIRTESGRDIERFSFAPDRLIIGCGSDGCHDRVEGRSPYTGDLLWPGSVELHNDPVTFVFVGDSLFYATKDRFFGLALATGNFAEINDFDFEGGAALNRIKEIPGGILLASNQNMVVFNRDGSSRYRRRYRAPGRSFWETVGRILAAAAVDALTAYTQTEPLYGSAGPYTLYPRLGERFALSTAAADYSYFYTQDPGATGREGFSLVKVREEDGREVGRAWVQQRNPEFVLDPIGERVFLLRSDKELIAIGFEPSR